MTDEEIKKYHGKVDENIKTHGYHTTFVFSKKEPSFCYSTGIYKSFGIPEIFISSLPQNLSRTLIKSYVDKFKNSNQVEIDTKIDDLTDRFSVYLIDVSVNNIKDYVLSSVRLYNQEDYKYVQLIYPDINGHFPNDEGYDYDQKILGQFKN